MARGMSRAPQSDQRIGAVRRSAAPRLYADANLMDRLIDQAYRGYTVTGLVGGSGLKFAARALQETDRRFHVRLLSDGIANAKSSRQSRPEKKPNGWNRLKDRRTSPCSSMRLFDTPGTDRAS